MIWLFVCAAVTIKSAAWDIVQKIETGKSLSFGQTGVKYVQYGPLKNCANNLNTFGGWFQILKHVNTSNMSMSLLTLKVSITFLSAGGLSKRQTFSRLYFLDNSQIQTMLSWNKWLPVILTPADIWKHIFRIQRKLPGRERGNHAFIYFTCRQFWNRVNILRIGQHFWKWVNILEMG